MSETADSNTITTIALSWARREQLVGGVMKSKKDRQKNTVTRKLVTSSMSDLFWASFTPPTKLLPRARKVAMVVMVYWSAVRSIHRPQALSSALPATLANRVRGSGAEFRLGLIALRSAPAGSTGSRHPRRSQFQSLRLNLPTSQRRGNSLGFMVVELELA